MSYKYICSLVYMSANVLFSYQSANKIREKARTNELFVDSSLL